MAKRLAVGVDLGGTRVRLLATDAAGRWSRRLDARSPALADLPRFLSGLWRRWGLSRRDVDALVVGAKGVWTASERRHEAGRLRQLAKRVRVVSDAQTAFLGALGDAAAVVVLSGTGSIVLGRNHGGRWARAGGLGPLVGDEGSAFWIGREWLRWSTSDGEDVARAMKIIRAPNAVARIAALAPAVLRKARRGHREARAIVAASQAHLASLAAQVAHRLRLASPVALSWAGSLLDDAAFRRGLWRALRRRGIRPRVVLPARSPVEAAHSAATRLARGARR